MIHKITWMRIIDKNIALYRYNSFDNGKNK